MADDRFTRFNNNLEVDFAMNIGGRKSMEDFIAIKQLDDGIFLGVYDGHGGTRTAELVSTRLYTILSERMAFSTNLNEEMWTDVFERMQFHVRGLRDSYSGSTAVCAYIKKLSTGEWYISSANIGDSRGVLVTSTGYTKRISNDHKASDPDEVDHVEEHGGRVYCNRVDGRLAVSRAFGNTTIPGVTQIPFTSSITLSEKLRVKYLVIASDGVWDVISDQNLGKYLSMSVRANETCDFIASSILDRAIFLGSQDNISVIVVRF